MSILFLSARNLKESAWNSTYLYFATRTYFDINRVSRRNNPWFSIADYLRISIDLRHNEQNWILERQKTVVNTVHIMDGLLSISLHASLALWST